MSKAHPAEAGTEDFNLYPKRASCDSISRRQVIGALAAPLLAPLLSCKNDLFAPRPSLQAGENSMGITLIGAGDQHAVDATKKAAFAVRAKTASMVQAVLDADPSAVAFNAGDLSHKGSALELEAYNASWGQFRERTVFTSATTTA